MADEPPLRSRAALLRIVRHYGERPEFVVLGGLVPELLCAGSAFQNAGTTDVDVQVDPEIACGAVVRELRARIDGVARTAEVNVSGLARFLLAKAAAAFSRRRAKDWYDIAFVLLRNDAGGPSAAAELVQDRLTDEIDAVATALDDLRANFETPDAQEPRAYVQQMRTDHPDLDPTTPAADAVLAVGEFHRSFLRRVD